MEDKMNIIVKGVISGDLRREKGMFAKEEDLTCSYLGGPDKKVLIAFNIEDGETVELKVPLRSLRIMANSFKMYNEL